MQFYNTSRLYIKIQLNTIKKRIEMYGIETNSNVYKIFSQVQN